VVLPSDLPVEVYGGSPAAPTGIFDDRPTLSELEKRYIALVLGECGGNKKKAAERLGIDRRTLYRALERAGVAAGSEDDGEDG
jgi:two-component system NtrC family response regulator